MFGFWPLESYRAQWSNGITSRQLVLEPAGHYYLLIADLTTTIKTEPSLHYTPHARFIEYERWNKLQQ